MELQRIANTSLGAAQPCTCKCSQSYSFVMQTCNCPKDYNGGKIKELPRNIYTIRENILTFDSETFFSKLRDVSSCASTASRIENFIELTIVLLDFYFHAKTLNEFVKNEIECRFIQMNVMYFHGNETDILRVYVLHKYKIIINMSDLLY